MLHFFDDLFDADVPIIHTELTPVETKPCYLCEKTLPITDFWKETSNTGARKTACKVCLSKNAKSGREARKALGVKPPDGFVCICGKPYQSTSTRRDFNGDHDHKSGQPRDFLCRECNTTLGKVRDDPVILAKMIGYLIHHGKPIDEKLTEALRAFI